MAKLKTNKRVSLKWTFFIYIPICVVMSWAGSWSIGNATNSLQELYEEEVFDIQKEFHESRYYITTDSDGTISAEPAYYKESYESGELKHQIIYGIISYAQAGLIPLWVLFCVALTGIVFYKRELEKPLKVLNEASGKIGENCLEFEIPIVNNNELGDLCRSFEKMRVALYQNNQKTWRMLEERKQLNAAFAHDIRTPITVLKGYTDLLQKYEGVDNFTVEKKDEILELMKQQVERLENYAQKMSTLQKLEDIEVHQKLVPIQSIVDKCKEMCRILLPKNNEMEIEIHIEEKISKDEVYVDEELVLEVFENLLTNALRYVKKHINVSICCDEAYLAITVEDDGQGFSTEELASATKPFYCSVKEQEENHFGLGLYICSVICQKSDGILKIENGKNGGGKVSANFSLK